MKRNQRHIYWCRLATVFRQVVLRPAFKGDGRSKYSTYDTAAFRNGPYIAVIPTLEAARVSAAEEAARDDAARVLQRTFDGLLVRKKCRTVCYTLMEVRPRGVTSHS